MEHTFIHLSLNQSKYFSKPEVPLWAYERSYSPGLAVNHSSLENNSCWENTNTQENTHRCLGKTHSQRESQSNRVPLGVLVWNLVWPLLCPVQAFALNHWLRWSRHAMTWLVMQNGLLQDPWCNGKIGWMLVGVLSSLDFKKTFTCM